MIILGVDPGTRTTGFGVIEVLGSRFRYLEAGGISLAATDDMSERLLKLSFELGKIIHQYKPEAMAVEKIFHAVNVQSALKLGYARGVILLEAAKKGLSIGEYTPTSIKQAVTGYGRAEKTQVQEMVRILLGLEQVPKPHDAADALAVAICHAHSGADLTRINTAEDEGKSRIPRAKGGATSWRNYKGPYRQG